MSGRLCPTTEHRPRSEEGAALWRLAGSSQAWRTAVGGQVRFDRAALDDLELELSPAVRPVLVSALEAGALAELNRQQKERDQARGQGQRRGKRP